MKQVGIVVPTLAEVQARKRNYLVGIPIFAKISIFVYLIYSCLPFSSSYEQLLFRNVDDMAMIESITKHQEAILQLDLQFIFFKYDYAYGWLFWITYAVFSFPAFILTKIFPQLQYFETFHILSNRMLSVLLIFVTMYLIKRIILLISNNDTYLNKIVAEILSFSILLYPSVGYWAGRVQPAALSSLFFVLCLLLVLRFRNDSSPNRFSLGRLSLSYMDFAVISLGSLLGVKPTNIPFIGLFFAIYLIVLSEKGIRFKNLLRTAFRHAVLGITAGLTSAAPSVLVYPVKSVSKILENIRFFSKNVTVDEIKLSEIPFNVDKGFLTSGMGTVGFAIVFCYGILIICRSRIGVRRTLKLIVVLAGSLMPILFFSVSSKNPMVLTIYLFPLIVAQVFLVPLITAVDFRKVRFQKFILPLMFLGSVFINFSQNLASESNGKYAINTYLSDSNSTDRVKQVEAQQALSKLIVDRRPITIVQSYRSPTLVSNLRRNVLVLYSFDNWGQYLDIANIDYVLINQNDLARLNSQDQELQIAEQKNRTQELRIGIDLIDRLFIDNYFGDQKCRQIASEYGNTLFSCS